MKEWGTKPTTPRRGMDNPEPKNPKPNWNPPPQKPKK